MAIFLLLLLVSGVFIGCSQSADTASAAVDRYFNALEQNNLDEAGRVNVMAPLLSASPYLERDIGLEVLQAMNSRTTHSLGKATRKDDRADVQVTVRSPDMIKVIREWPDLRLRTKNPPDDQLLALIAHLRNATSLPMRVDTGTVTMRKAKSTGSWMLVEMKGLAPDFTVAWKEMAQTNTAAASPPTAAPSTDIAPGSDPVFQMAWQRCQRDLAGLGVRADSPSMVLDWTASMERRYTMYAAGEPENTYQTARGVCTASLSRSAGEWVLGKEITVEPADLIIYPAERIDAGFSYPCGSDRCYVGRPLDISHWALAADRDLLIFEGLAATVADGLLAEVPHVFPGQVEHNRPSVVIYDRLHSLRGVNQRYRVLFTSSESMGIATAYLDVVLPVRGAITNVMLAPLMPTRSLFLQP